MITSEDINEIIEWIEKHPLIGAAILGSIAYTLKGIIQSIKKYFSKESDYATPVFWTLGRKYRILAVHKYIPSEDTSGWIQTQNSRPDQWRELIEINSTLINFRHKIRPKNKTDTLAVIISRDGKEKHKVIEFNK